MTRPYGVGFSPKLFFSLVSYLMQGVVLCCLHCMTENSMRVIAECIAVLFKMPLPFLAVMMMWGIPTEVNAVPKITFCMVTTARPVSYLARVLDTFVVAEKVNHVDGVGLVVVNPDNSTLSGSDAAKLAGFVVHPPVRKMAVCDTPDVEGLPICKVRQGTLDVTESLLYCAERSTQWVVLLEDDCEACPGSIQEVVDTLSTLNATEISFAKFSKIATGVAFSRDKVSLYAKNAQAHIYDSPHDYFRESEWDLTGSARVYVHSRNLFHHIGSVSTIPYRNEKVYHDQYDGIRSDFCGEQMS